MHKYIWELPNWRNFSWNEKELLPLISSIRLKQGQLIQKVTDLFKDDLKKAEAIVLEEETLKTARIEGEKYNPESVRSSIHRRLGLDYAGLPRTEKHIDGLVEVLLDATVNHEEPLTENRLFSWHAALFPTGHSGLSKIEVGKYRPGPMRVVSGPIGREKLHYQAPSAERISKEMNLFFTWWHETKDGLDGIIRAGIAHFYFVTIHPFDDGNGRITRALTDMALAQDDELPSRYYSLSNEIIKKRKEYYNILEKTQKGDDNITNWLLWFTSCVSSALDNSEILLQDIFAKTEFWRKNKDITIGVRQKKVINKMLDAGKNKFKGGLTTRKYMAFTKISRRTAVREIQDLLHKGLLKQNDGRGRSISYDINYTTSSQTQ